MLALNLEVTLTVLGKLWEENRNHSIYDSIFCRNFISRKVEVGTTPGMYLIRIFFKVEEITVCCMLIETI
jgi:hypothetical protein